MRSFYLSFTTNDMIYRVGGTGSVADEVIQEASSELELYEGESVEAFPFPLEGTASAYAGPNQFIGVVYYNTLPCRPLKEPLYSLPCPLIPTISPVPTSSAPITNTPTTSLIPSFSPTMYVTPEVRSSVS